MLNDDRTLKNRSNRIDLDELHLKSKVAQHPDLCLKITTRHVTVFLVVVAGNKNNDDAVRVHCDCLSSQDPVQIHTKAPIDSGVAIQGEQLIHEEEGGKIHRLCLRKPVQVETLRDSVPESAFQVFYRLMQLWVVNPPLCVAFYVVFRLLGVDSRIEPKVVKTSASGNRCWEDGPDSEGNQSCDQEKAGGDSQEKSHVHLNRVSVVATQIRLSSSNATVGVRLTFRPQ